jgi:hypothetical protein
VGRCKGPNLYQYALNNPVNFSDPMGLDTCPDCRVYNPKKPVPRSGQLSSDFLGSEVRGFGRRLPQLAEAFNSIPSTLPIAAKDLFWATSRAGREALYWMTDPSLPDLAGAWKKFAGSFDAFLNAPLEQHAEGWGSALADATMLAGPAAAAGRLGTSGVSAYAYPGEVGGSLQFPAWRVGDASTKITPSGRYPFWSIYDDAASAAARVETIQGRHWMNRAHLARPGEFTERQLRSMREGFAPQVRARVWNRRKQAVETKWLSKELHHARRNRGVPGFDSPIDVYEVWPWQHATIDPHRNIAYEVLEILEGNL